MDWRLRIAEFERLNPQDESGPTGAPPPKADNPPSPAFLFIVFLVFGVAFAPGLMPLALLAIFFLSRL